MSLATLNWESRQFAVDYDTGFSASLEWDVSDVTDEAQALIAPPIAGGRPIPTIGTPHPLNANMHCRNVGVSEWRGPTFAVVRADYTENPNEFDPDPLIRKAKVRWGQGCIGEATNQDADGNPMLASNRQPFSGLTADKNTLFLTVTAPVPYYDVAQAVQYQNKVNLGSWTPPDSPPVTEGQAKCISILPRDEYIPGHVIYLWVDYNFELRAEGFDHLPIDQGTFGYGNNGTNTPSTPIGTFFYKTVPPCQVDGPVLLDGTGKPLNTNIGVGPSALTALAYPGTGNGGVNIPLKGTLETAQDGVTKRLRYKKHTKISFSIFTWH